MDSTQQQQALDDLANATKLLAEATALIQASDPPPPPPPPVVRTGLQKVQDWLGEKTVGVYIGVESHNWSQAQFSQAANTLKSWGADYALVKCGEGGMPVWYGGLDGVAAVRKAFADQGLGCAPYWYCLPNGGQAQIDACVTIAKLAGGIVLDCEDEFAGQDVALAALLNGICDVAPDACIIVTGYGSPITRFGPHGWPYHTLATSKIAAYQPQLYFGVWDVYHRAGAHAAIDWGMAQCAQAYGANMVFQPAINIQGVGLDAFQPAADYLKNWKASLCLWELTQGTAAILKALKTGISS